ncbi:MAG: hypothetical protein ACXWE4_02460 [Methylobacter sp.]
MKIIFNPVAMAIFTTFFAMTLSSSVSAETKQITSYDIEQTPVSGFGCWTHNFTGTITDTGRTVSGSVNCSADGIGHVLNYSNGSGTLNDGLFDTTHLLLTRTDDQGQPLQPVITLHFGGVFTINEIRLLKGNNSFTNITGATVQIGATELPITPTPIGGDPKSVLLDLRGIVLAGIPTSQITVKNFSASFFGSPIDQFGIGEIEVDGSNVVLTPTNKDQCKKNGWKNFGFIDQGHCIEFVNAGE